MGIRLRDVGICGLFLTIVLICTSGLPVRAGNKNQDFLDACRRGDLQKVESLLAEGANPNAKDRNRLTPLMIASGYVEIPKGKPQPTSVTFPGAERGYPALVKLLLKKGAKVNEKDRYGMTALMAASGYVRVPRSKKAMGLFVPGANLDIVRILLDHGAKIDAKDKDGVTALSSACGQIKVVRSVGRGGSSEVGVTTRNPNVAVVELLLEKGAKPNTRDRAGISPVLITALQARNPLCLDMLMKHGGNINVKDKIGATPLDWVATNGRLELVKTVVGHGADIHATNSEGLTAMMKAAYKGHEPVVEFLLDKGSRINAKSKGGQTALIFAATEGHVDVVKLLLERGADVKARDGNGHTALRYARKKKQKEIEKVLREHGAKR